ncbi:hypothetical protein [Flavobacterium hydatis]|uniref:Uncharacterized protein n=1 Tax=Flavobacterium hydatis TaxID=991 RepID=A0ABX4CJ61_FLAHY|nr:hypothetical protein [Flavobacterium hydatis]OXA95402.1 hypothetical protein B0A62_08825 [Flavobacterium hydatis]
MKDNKNETHHFLPSGEWEGFYCYSNSPAQHKMSIELNFVNSIISGSGVDDVNSFKWNGSYNLEHFKIKMVKTYPTHIINYNGDIDENGIWGVWDNPEDLSFFANLSPNIYQQAKAMTKGCFHIWPKAAKNESKEEIKEEVKESKKLKEFYIQKI